MRESLFARARVVGGLVMVCVMSVGAGALAQETPPGVPAREVELTIDSGPLRSPTLDVPEVMYSVPISVPGARWLRLKFGDVSFAGDPAANGAVIRIMSLHDSAVQYLNAETLSQWRSTSAYFNGDTVIVDVIAQPWSGESRLVIEGVTAGLPDVTPDGKPRATTPGGYGQRALCGDDDRLPSFEPGNARLLPAGCTAFMFNDANRMFLSAGQCGVNGASVVQFNVPLSLIDGTIVNPPPQDQYPVDVASIQSSNAGLGGDWAYFGVFPNSNTRLTPFQAQGQFYTLATQIPGPGTTVRVTGYGSAVDPISRTWNQIQRSALGPYVSEAAYSIAYRADTSGGTSGSPVVDTQTQRVLAIHTNAGCETGGGNQGTKVNTEFLLNALANPLGVCASGVPGPGGPTQGALFAVGDIHNNFGQISSAGTFTSLAQLVPMMQGMAYDGETDRFLAIDSTRGLYAIGAGTGSVQYLGTVDGATEVITGLGYDPYSHLLYGIAQATGQLYSVKLTTMRARAVGGRHGGTIGAMDFDTYERVLYAIDDAPGGSRLVRISASDGSQVVIGELGAGINDCNGLAYDPNDRTLYCINAATGDLLAVSASTGHATLVGNTGGVFGASFGLAARQGLPGNCTADIDRDGDSGTDADIESFFAVLAGNPCATCGSIDLDGDGDVGTDADIEAFFRVLGGGRC